MSLFCCPLCGGPLTRGPKSYLCPSGHCFDIAREGYVYLLPVSQKHSKDPGDDPNMVHGRTRFLDGGYYAPLRQALCDLAVAHTGNCPRVLDSGCGEGYYTGGISAALALAGRGAHVAGVDLSKTALRHGARRVPEAEFAAASVYHLPVSDHTIDLLVNCFSPLASSEFLRVLKPRGVFLYVVPGPRHLFELKEVLYDSPYENPLCDTGYDGFRPLAVLPVEAQLHLPDRQTVEDLFFMTPYCWKTPQAGVARLKELDGLDVTASFRIHVFEVL